MKKRVNAFTGKKKRRLTAALLMMMALLSACGNNPADSREKIPEAVSDAEAWENPAAEPEEEVRESPEAVSDAEAWESPEAEQEKEVRKSSEAVLETEAESIEAVPEPSWAGKRVSICGDSISTFTGYIPENYSKFYPENGAITEVEDTWWMQVAKRTGMEICRNASYSGSTVSGWSQDEQDGRFSCGNKRIADLTSVDGEAPEVILVLMGANDLLNNIPLGAYDGSSAVPEGNLETFSEAYALMLDKMKVWYPEAEIYCCTMTEVSRWNDAGEKFPFRNALGLTAKDYNDWIRATAQAKGASLIDVYDCGLTPENAQEYTSDGTHPNVEGARRIADKVCEAFGAS